MTHTVFHFTTENFTCYLSAEEWKGHFCLLYENPSFIWKPSFARLWGTSAGTEFGTIKPIGLIFVLGPWTTFSQRLNTELFNL